MSNNKLEKRIEEIKDKFERFLDWQVQEFETNGYWLDGYRVGDVDGYFVGILDDPDELNGMSKDDYIWEYFDWRNDSLNEILFKKFLEESGIRLKEKNWGEILDDYSLIWFNFEKARKDGEEYEKYQKTKEELEEEQYKVLDELGDLFENWMYNGITNSSFQISRSSTTSSFYVKAGKRKLKVSSHPHFTNNKNYEIPSLIYLYCPEDKLSFFKNILKEESDSIRESFNRRGYVEKSYKIFTSRSALIRAIIKFIRNNQ